ncbi:hypothetical protein AST00_10865 [Staphylococcus equorum]|uniref:hypothetical protein n=1 Tax=Staphylococcus equorum TaxID=246432 RepID=UPI0008536840|nr:hypothetical protein [Staphylococcus equorum]OEK64402.1 hypothetical protein AST00_10865 [Staphylococcus equorum]
MENFNYNDEKYLELTNVKNKKIKKIYKDYEIINYSIDDNKLLMNDIKVAKVTNIDSKKTIKTLKGTIDFEDDNILTVSYTD